MNVDIPNAEKVLLIVVDNSQGTYQLLRTFLMTLLLL